MTRKPRHPAQELERWLADRHLQRRSREASEGFIDSWNASEIHRHFDERLSGSAPAGAEAIAEAVRELFANDAWVGSLIDSLAGRLRTDPFFEPPFPAIRSDIHQGLVVFRNDRVSIAVGVTHAVRLASKKSSPRAATSIGFTGHLGVLKFLRAGGAVLSLWEAPEITSCFTARDAGHCARVEERPVRDGDMLTIDGRRQGYVIEHARANLLIVQAEISTDHAPVRAEYDSSSLAFVGCSASDDSASRIQMIATLLRKLPCAEAVPALVGCLDHPDFFVRWHVMRELLGIDAEAALPHLRRMAARDPHPETRRAARKTLDRLAALDARTRKAA